MRKKIVMIGGGMLGASILLVIIIVVLSILSWFVPFIGWAMCCITPVGGILSGVLFVAGVIVLIVGFVMQEPGAPTGAPPPPGSPPPPPPPPPK